MVDNIAISLKPELHELYPPPAEFEEMWKIGGLHKHQYSALITDVKFGRIHAPTGTGKSRAAAFYAVAPFHKGSSDRVSATFAYPTNLLTKQQYEAGLIDGLVENLGYERLESKPWTHEIDGTYGIKYTRLRMPNGEELRIAKLTGSDLAQILMVSAGFKRKADMLQDFLDWLNMGHSFLISSPDLLAYATHEQYGSISKMYYTSVKRRLHSLLRGKTLILDEYHQYDPFTLINLENLLSDERLAPERVLLLSATQRKEYFHAIPDIPINSGMPDAIGESRLASREIQVNFHFKATIPEPEEISVGLTLFIHNSVVQNRSRCARLRNKGIRVVQWDGTRKDDANEELGKSTHLVLGTSAIEVGLDLDADMLFTEWSLRWMNPNQITQRIGRVGRRPAEEPATVHIFLSDALDSEISQILQHDGKSMTKDELNNILHDVCHTSHMNKSNYISDYYSEGGKMALQRKRLVQPNEEMLYHFRPPGTQALFLDKTEKNPFPFIYDKAPMVNRYETSHPMPEDIEMLEQGWKDLCQALHINLENDYLIIRGERQDRRWLATPTGHIDDLKKPEIRKYYIRTRNRGEVIGQII